MLYVQKPITLGKQCEILDYPEQSYRNVGSISVKYVVRLTEIIFLIIIIWNNLNVVSGCNYGKIPKQASIQTAQPHYPKFEIATEFQVGETQESIFFPSILGQSKKS